MKEQNGQPKSKKRRALEIILIILACIIPLLLLTGCGCGGLKMGCQICKHCVII